MEIWMIRIRFGVKARSFQHRGHYAPNMEVVSFGFNGSHIQVPVKMWSSDIRASSGIDNVPTYVFSRGLKTSKKRLSRSEGVARMAKGCLWSEHTWLFLSKEENAKY